MVIACIEVTVAIVDAKLPVDDLAVIVQEVWIRGAVNRPVVLMLPQEAVKVALLLAVNCCVAPSLTVGFSGEIANVEGAETTSYPYTVYSGATVATPSTVQGVPIAAVAVKRPLEVIVPHLAVQLTGAEAVNCCVDPSGVVAETGVMTIGETTVIFDVALSPPLVAVAVTSQVALGYSGAVNSPAEVIPPQLVFHVEGWLAVNC
jgi:hypothetical protein